MTQKWSSTFLNSDSRGLMGVVEQSLIPFDIQRIFWLTNVPSGETRGEHAHRRCEQFIICACGEVTCEVQLNDGTAESRVLLPGDTYFLATYTWLTLKNFSSNCLVIVCASEPYDESEYIRSYDEFKTLIN